MKKTASLAFLAVLLVGCASGAEWTKEGSSPQQTAAALADCQTQARNATKRDVNIMDDIMASRGHDWNQTGVMSTRLSEFTAENNNRTGDIVKNCMIGKGFVPH